VTALWQNKGHFRQKFVCEACSRSCCTCKTRTLFWDCSDLCLVKPCKHGYLKLLLATGNFFTKHTIFFCWKAKLFAVLLMPHFPLLTFHLELNVKTAKNNVICWYQNTVIPSKAEDYQQNYFSDQQFWKVCYFFHRPSFSKVLLLNY